MTIAADSLSTAAPFVSYAYSYPHKSAYRPFANPLALGQVWRDEPLAALSLYFHVPFCEYRCGFCNLFTLATADVGLTTAYLRQLCCEALAVGATLKEARFARIAIGGGTPTFLSETELTELFHIVGTVMGAEPTAVPVSCEASPATLTSSKARLLSNLGVDRLSLGVQSFIDAESRRLGRPQQADDVRRAIDIVRQTGFPVLNLDLIYGVPDQSVVSWLRSVAEAVRYAPEEMYLYPLYVRELTGLGKVAAAPGDNRLEAYREARHLLLDSGYEQVSLRMFRLPGSVADNAPVFCCQTDGMVGLGCGARSYTREIHYSTEFAVGRSSVRSIMLDYLRRNGDGFHCASYGYQLDGEDQRRRFVIQSLLQAEGLNLDDYRRCFLSELLDDLPQLTDLIERGLAVLTTNQFRLTRDGLEMSDAIGPWIYSARVRQLMESFACR